MNNLLNRAPQSRALRTESFQAGSNFLSEPFFSLTARVVHVFISVYRELRDVAQRYLNTGIGVRRERKSQRNHRGPLSFVPSRPISSRLVPILHVTTHCCMTFLAHIPMRPPWYLSVSEKNTSRNGERRLKIGRRTFGISVWTL